MQQHCWMLRGREEKASVLPAAAGQLNSQVIFWPNGVNQSLSPHAFVSAQLVKQISNICDILEKSEDKMNKDSFWGLLYQRSEAS